MFDHLNELNHQQRYFREEYNSVPDSSEMREEVTAEFHNKGGIRELEKMRKEVHRGRHKRALLRKRDRAGGYSVMDLTGIRDPRDTAAAQVKEEERNGPDGSKGMESSGTEKRPRSRSRSPLRQQPSKQVRYSDTRNGLLVPYLLLHFGLYKLPNVCQSSTRCKVRYGSISENNK